MLMLATTAAMIEQFNKNNILILEEMGYEVHVIGNWKVGNPISEERLSEFKVWLGEHHGKWFHMDSTRKPYDLKNNVSAYKKVVKLIEQHNYNFIHCHTPIGSVIARLAAHKTNTKVIYTAHGFHFYDGAPIINWLLYYPVEKLLSYWTDVLITINKEDYNRAKNKFHAKKIEYIQGVGIDTGKYHSCFVERSEMRKELGVKETDFLLVSVGELNENKNHEVIIRAIAKLNNPSIKYVILGQGGLKNYLLELSKKLGVEEHIFLVGYKSNVKDYLHMADVFAFPSRREGLGLAALEAMASGLPILASDIHGIRDYLIDGVTGCAIIPESDNSVCEAIIRMLEGKELREKCSVYNKEVVKQFDVKHCIYKMRGIYGNFS